MSQTASLRLPVPLEIELQNFSLYDNTSRVRGDFGYGVFCLAGANGLGKSTFLAALNYAITGLVADPDRKFESVEEYYRFSLSFSATYFRGRIAPEDAEAAQVTLRFAAGDSIYTITRSMFEPQALRGLTIQTGNEIESFDGEDVADTERHDIYADRVTRDAGLTHFSQLAFLQHFILTFDERRDLVFWNEKVAQTALFIAFGVDLDQATKVENLRRTSEKADSLARNLQWQATEVRKRMEGLELAAGSDSDMDDDAVEHHRSLMDRRAELLSDRDRLTMRIDDAELSVASTKATLVAVEETFSQRFDSFMGHRGPVSSHPIIIDLLHGGHCAVCGQSGEFRAEALTQYLASHECPLCHRATPRDEPDDISQVVAEMEALESDVVGTRSSLAAQHADLGRLREQRESLDGEIEEISRQIGRLEESNSAVALGVAGSAIEPVLLQYREQVNELLARKDAERARRDRANDELEAMQQDLAVAYANAEESFLPLFERLAREFLGLSVTVDLHSSGTTSGLILSVQDTRRRDEGMLSESQRFFVDIALRMALAQHMAADGHAACLYVDTPEGSLDIAYERRAGSMFAQFVESGANRLIMTANINTSQLLHRLASACGSQHMVLQRMTTWTSLSDVQALESASFDTAFEEIEHALSMGQSVAID